MRRIEKCGLQYKLLKEFFRHSISELSDCINPCSTATLHSPHSKIQGFHDLLDIMLMPSSTDFAVLAKWLKSLFTNA